VKEQVKEQVAAEVAAILAKKPDAYSWDYINLSARHRFVFTGLTKKQLKLYLQFLLEMGAADLYDKMFSAEAEHK